MPDYQVLHTVLILGRDLGLEVSVKEECQRGQEQEAGGGKKRRKRKTVLNV